MKKSFQLSFAMFVVVTMISAVFFSSCGKIKSVTLNKTTLTLEAGDSETLLLIVTPVDAEYTAIWESSNNNVVTVTNKGKVTAVSPGTATVTVTVENKTASCKITVIGNFGHIEYDGKKYEMANCFWSEFPNVQGYSSIITIASKGVNYDSSFDGIMGTGNGIRISITHTESFPSITGTYIFGDYYESTNCIVSGDLLINKEFWVTSNPIEIESGTLTLSKSASTYTLDFTGKDEHGKSIKMHFNGAIQKIR